MFGTSFGNGWWTIGGESAPEPPAPTPQLADGYLGWWKADAGVTLSGSDVTQWDDQSGNGNHLTPDSGVGSPTLASSWSNALPGIYFLGQQQLSRSTLSTSLGTAPGVCTIFAACQTPSGNLATNSALTSDYNNSSGTETDPTIAFVNDTATNGRLYNGSEISITTQYSKKLIIEAVFNGVNSYFKTYYGGSVFLDAGDTGNLTFSTGFRVGGQVIDPGGPSENFNNPWYQGYLGELVLYNSLLTSTEKEESVAYLQNRWGI